MTARNDTPVTNNLGKRLFSVFSFQSCDVIMLDLPVGVFWTVLLRSDVSTLMLVLDQMPAYLSAPALADHPPHQPLH